MKLYKDLTAEEIRMIRERVYELRHTYELSYRDIADEVRDEFNVNLLPERIHTMDLAILRKKWCEMEN